jgi:hypothetical protein
MHGIQKSTYFMHGDVPVTHIVFLNLDMDCFVAQHWGMSRPKVWGNTSSESVQRAFSKRVDNLPRSNVGVFS